MNPIDEAARALEIAKFAEARATAERLRAEQALVELMPAKTEGSVSMKGADYKVSITYAMNRTVDAPALAAIKDSIAPDLLEQAVTYKPSLVLAGLRYLQSNEPDAYAVLAQAITSKPAKPSVKIERIAEDVREAA
jgi:hypothetical protein